MTTVYAKKLNVNFPDLLALERYHLNSYGKLRISKTPSVVRWSLHEVNEFINVFPKLKPYLYKAAFTQLKLLTPHIHTNEKTMINFYHKSGGEVTSFWDGNEYVQDDRLTMDNGDTYYNVDAKKLEVKYRFTAQEKDVWILNTAKAHSVLPSERFEQNMKEDRFRDKKLIHYNKKIERTAISLAFLQPIDEVLDILYG